MPGSVDALPLLSSSKQQTRAMMMHRGAGTLSSSLPAAFQGKFHATNYY
jgi:hypothetical protein